MNWPEPLSKGLSVLGPSQNFPLKKTLTSSPSISSDFYVIKIVNFSKNHMLYGRSQYDFQSGCLVFMAPTQVIEWQEVNWLEEVTDETFIINFHKDFLINTSLQDDIKKYHFFEYFNNEALNLSCSEKTKIIKLFQLIEQEYLEKNFIENKCIILNLIRLILDYSNQFYTRQFNSRVKYLGSFSLKVNQFLQQYYADDHSENKQIPTVNFIANKLSYSTKYLSDAIKVESGLSTQELLHRFILERAKSKLLAPRVTVAEVAYSLGFDYPQYFSRLFKKKIGLSPTAFQKKFNQEAC